MIADAPENGFPEKTAAALLSLIKLVALANAGGVVATMTVIGATAKNGGVENILALPLGLFASGASFAVLYAMSYFLRVAEYESWETPPRFFVNAWFIRFTGYGAVALFLAGCISGVLVVASI